MFFSLVTKFAIENVTDRSQEKGTYYLLHKTFKFQKVCDPKVYVCTILMFMWWCYHLHIITLKQKNSQTSKCFSQKNLFHSACPAFMWSRLRCWFFWGIQFLGQFLPNHCTSCIHLVQGSTFVPCSWAARIKASGHPSRDRTGCQMCGSGPWC